MSILMIPGCKPSPPAVYVFLDYEWRASPRPLQIGKRGQWGGVVGAGRFGRGGLQVLELFAFFRTVLEAALCSQELVQIGMGYCISRTS